MNVGERVRAIQVVIPPRGFKEPRPLTAYQRDALRSMVAAPLRRYKKGWVATNAKIINFSTVVHFTERKLALVTDDGAAAVLTDKGRELAS